MMRNLGLDLVRCLAIGLILLAHIGQSLRSPLGEAFGMPRFYYVTWGGVAVTIFLALSGLVLQLQYRRKAIDYPQFLAKRALRIYPVYYLSLLFGLGVYALKSQQELGSVGRGLAQLSWADLGLSLTGGYAFAGQWGGPLVGTSWFVGLIMVMYAVFPWLSRAMTRSPYRTIGILLAISLVWRVMIGQTEVLPMRPLDWFPLCRVFEFGLGMFWVEMMQRRQEGPRKDPEKDPERDSGKSQWKQLERFGPTIVRLSELSFPLFLIHYPFMFVIRFLTLKGVPAVIAIGVFLAVSLGLSWGLMLLDRKVPRKQLMKLMFR
jgi:peptidoglycan/LPS O-acetylase OafA/YrhL